MRTAVFLDFYTIWALPAFLTHFCTDWVETTAVFIETNVPGTVQDYDIEWEATHINGERSLLIQFNIFIHSVGIQFTTNSHPSV